jgi:MOSC domain-containing protein YiiM
MAEHDGASGEVVAVCLSGKRGIPKYPQVIVRVGMQGIEGDYHAGPTNRHKKRGRAEPNHRMLTVVAVEVIDELNRDLGLALTPGALAENVLVRGLGDLSDLAPGDRLGLGPEVVIEVTTQNKPCATIGVYHAQVVKQTLGRRGITAVVVRPGDLRPGDAVRVERRAPITA